MHQPEHRHAVLVIEDDPAIRHRLQEVLTAEGCNVILATDVADVAELLSSERRPCIVFFDTTFSRVDADFLMKQLDRHPSYGRPPIIALRASGVPEGVRVVGALDCTEKPFAFGRILDVVAKSWARSLRGRTP